MDAPGDCCKRAELAAAYYMGAAGGSPPDCLVTENAAFTRRAYKLLRELGGVSPEVVINRKQKTKKNASYIVRLKRVESFTGIIFGGARKKSLRSLTSKKCCKKAALRGSFLTSGSVTDPEKQYHLEIYCKDAGLADYLSGLMRGFGLNPKITNRSDYHVAYLKDSGGIVDFLNIIGAYRALMSFENTRILKGMRNSVNRAVNCETANITKTADASLRQIASISYIKESIGFDALPVSLREIAAIREANTEISLSELGQMLDPPLGKSGVNHRLRRLDAIAADMRRRRDSP